MKIFSEAFCKALIESNPGKVYPDCNNTITTITTPTTGGPALVYEDPKSTRFDSTITDSKIFTEPPTTPTQTWTTTFSSITPKINPTKNQLPSTHSPQKHLPKIHFPKICFPICQKIRSPNPTRSSNTPEPILAVSNHHDQDHEPLIQWLKDLPWYGWVMPILAILILVMMTVSRCCKKIAEALKENHPGEYIRQVGCLEDTAKYTYLFKLVLQGLRNALSAVIGNSQHRETRNNRQ